MADLGTMSISEREIMKGATFEVDVRVRRSCRVQIGLLLIALGCLLMGARFRVEG